MAKRFYVTTPIYYVSDVPHLGHAYTTVVADALARYHRLRGDQTLFLTGADEHGQKIARMAEERGLAPKAYADQIAEAYRRSWEALAISNDDFIRTTDPDHEQVVQELWRKLEAQGDIYLSEYEGWYCVPCEQFYTEKELEAEDCPVHHRPVERVKEQSYYFRLSRYRQALLDHYAQHPGFIQPIERRNEVRAFVEGELKDLSVSRTTFTWGIAVPDHPGHVVYVWIDALSNYYSATRRSREVDFWGEDVQIVHLLGKEISRFHAVYWPAMLLAAGLRLPNTVFCHGWWTVNGDKMSKTAGNVVDPVQLAADLGVDAFRYFVLREIPLGADGDFSHQALLTRYNAELANDLGNLLNRTLGMIEKYFPGQELASPTEELRGEAEAAREAVATEMDSLQPSGALVAIWALVRRANAYIDQTAPFRAEEPRRREILWTLCEALRFLGTLTSPFLPERSAELRRQLGEDAEPIWPAWDPGRRYRVAKAAPLFPRVDDDRRAELLARWTSAAAAAKQAASAASAAKPATATVNQATTAAPSPPREDATLPRISYADFQRLDLRVGRIKSAEAVPKAKKLLKLTVDLGTDERQVVAGIAETYRPEELPGKQVIFLANLEPATIRGVLSEGMILAAGDEQVVALSGLDREATPGTKVR